MKLRTTIVLLVAVIGVFCGLWVADRRERGNDGRINRTGDPLLTLDADVTDRVSLATTNLTVSLIRQDGHWYLQKPIRARADDGQVARLLGGLEALTCTDVIPARQRAQRGLDLADYGLLDPRARWVLRGGAHTSELLVGLDAPLGNQVYVKFAGNDNVLATSPALMGLLPRSPDDLRDRHVLYGPETRVSRIELDRPERGFVRLMRSDGRWFLRQPVEARADRARVNALLDALFAVQVERFVWDGDEDQPATGAAGMDADPDERYAQYGLADDDTLGSAQIWLDGDLVSYELLVGSTASNETVFVRRRDLPSVFAVSTGVLDCLDVPVDSLRAHELYDVDALAIRYVSIRTGERKLVMVRESDGPWLIREPVQWRADTQAVQDLLGALTRWSAVGFAEDMATDTVARAMSPPTCVIRLATRTLDEAAAAEGGARNWSGDGEALWIGSMMAGATQVLARFEGQSTVSILPGAVLADLGDDPVDALAYRERAMLTIPSPDVQRMSLERDGREQVVVRAAGQGWASADGNTNRVEIEVINDVLFLVSNLRAARAEAHNPDSLKAYGLDPPRCSLTLGLTGETGIQKSILFGSPSREHGVYAMVRGQDVVFTLAAPVADMLSRNLLAAE